MCCMFIFFINDKRYIIKRPSPILSTIAYLVSLDTGQDIVISPLHTFYADNPFSCKDSAILSYGCIEYFWNAQEFFYNHFQ